MKYAFTTILALSLTCITHAMEKTCQELKETGSLITETIASVEPSSMSDRQKQILCDQLSTIQKQHQELTESIQRSAALKQLLELALRTHQETLRAIEEAQKQDPTNERYASLSKSFTHIIEMHEQLLSK